MDAMLFLALKDILKDKKTLLMIIFVIGIGVTASLIMSGLFNGFTDYFNDVTINVMTGHVSISPEENKAYLTGIADTERKIELLPEVIGVSSRLAVNGIISRQNKEAQARITGINPSNEIKTTKIADKVVSGEFLGDSDKDILVGSALADTLKARIGEKVTITFRNGAVREYKIKGFLDTGARSGDETAVYMTSKELESVLGIKDSASQVIIKLTDVGLADKAKTDIMQLGVRGDIKTWKELSSYVAQITQNFYFIVDMISFISLTAAAISVAVVMFINVEHKTREIGILKAIGGRNSFVMKVFLTEILIYALLGITLGNLLGYGVVAYLKAFPAVWFIGSGGAASIAIIPELAFKDVISASISVFVVTLAAGIYPVRTATKMDIIKAIWSGG